MDNVAQSSHSELGLPVVLLVTECKIHVFQKLMAKKLTLLRLVTAEWEKNCQKIHVAGWHRRKERRRKGNPNSCEKHEHKINKKVFL